jgi:hypothetical protein
VSIWQNHMQPQQHSLWGQCCERKRATKSSAARRAASDSYTAFRRMSGARPALVDTLLRRGMSAVVRLPIENLDTACHRAVRQGNSVLGCIRQPLLLPHT